jgi:hypothetical protein
MNSALQAGDVDVDYIPSGDAAIWDQTITLRESFSSQATGKLIFNASVPAKVRIINGHVQITESSLPGYTLHYAKARLTIDSAGATAVTDYVGLTGSVSDLERFQQVVNAQAVLATGSTLNIQCTGITGAGTTGVTGFVNLTLIPEP